MVATRREEERLAPDDRLAQAVVAVVQDQGYEHSDLEDFAARAGISRAELARRFPDKSRLTVAVLDGGIADFKGRVGAAYARFPTWPDNLRAACWEAAAWIGEHPGEVWFGMVGLLGAGDMVLVRREGLFRWATGLVDSGRAAAPEPENVPASAAVHVVGSVVETLRRYQEGTLVGDAFTTVPRIMYGAVRPYLGEEAARRELEIPPPTGWRGGGRRR
jgi:AcrR family transcriptional regulator